MVTGRVLRFDQVRGYGFIAPHSGGEDVFLHANDLVDEKHLVRPGAVVEFQVTGGDRGLKATGVRVVEQAAGVPAGQPHSVAEVGDGLCEVLPSAEFQQEITEVLIKADPTLTGAQILRVRQEFARLAEKYGWIEN
ncbi:cold shock domain-containing protein [Solihabitans fulvus]|uniref:Cold shock domain-containing protein n=1 Tax=Solihabitans fulvus TaxID=1892852 RepID=A0A5B2X4R3_9PSEU|nr:cold shock domain-containing protein [Solihabitans fulvus]KAA2258129.1 cold shock domain-containing protein [Solihabitans fulvus]